MIKAIIFDMDGVISDTQKLHAKAENQVLSNHGLNISEEELTNKYAGVPDKDFFRMIIKEYKLNISVEEIHKEKWRIMEDLIKNLSEVDYATDLIKILKKNNYKLAVGSSSSFNFIKLVLSKLGVIDLFDAIASIDEVTQGKPKPDIFLLAAKKLSIAPEFCLVIEDGYAGMQAAQAAGMKCIGLVKNKKARNYPTNILVGNLREIKNILFL